MNNTQIITIENLDGTTTEHIVIHRGNGEYTSMPKSTYDEIIAEQSTLSIPEGGN